MLVVLFYLIDVQYIELVFQSILRQTNFKGAKLLGASFFDADLTGLISLLFSCTYLG